MRRRKVETSGGGAIMGFVLGALIGLPYGSIWIFLLSIVGAFIGDYIEYKWRKRQVPFLR